MKKTLFATTALAGLAIGSVASAQGIALFGDARLGLGYNIYNNGAAIADGDDGHNDLRAVSRVRFGVNMTGETDSGITFGATIRADNSTGGQGGANGQSAGNVFVSGDLGTLTFGDTNGADEQWVGDVPGNFSLTGLGDTNETLYTSNGGGFGSDNTNDLISNPFARPTIRYDFEIMGFGGSVSSNRDLTDIGVGVGYSGDFGGGSWGIGVGYYDFASFDNVNTNATFVTVEDAVTGDLVQVPGVPDEDVVAVESGHQWSVGLNGDYESFGLGVIYTQIESDGDASAAELLVGGSFGWEAFSVGAWYAGIMNADGAAAGRDGDDSFGVSAQYDLGGGASINGGVAQTFGSSSDSEETVADFGIKMAF
jgi:outer membrane protein OmpU